MINKFYKTIHNKYSRFIRFIFFLRYLFSIFLITILLFLFIPKFFDYEKKADVFKNYLSKNYDFYILKYEKIEFIPLPLPKIEFHNVLIKVGETPMELNVKKLQIYPKIFNIYNYNNFESNKIIFKKSNISLQNFDFQSLIKKLISQKSKLNFNKIDFYIYNKNKLLVTLDNVKFANYGLKKNIVNGNIFGKKFEVKINDKFNQANFKLINSGISFVINLNERKIQNLIKGTVKSKILGTNLKFDFKYNQKSFDIYNSFFRSKNLSFSNQSKINLNPFLDIYSDFEILNINFKIFEKIQIDKLLSFKNVLKKINAKNEISFTSKKLSNNLKSDFKIKFDLAYGRLDFLKNLSFTDNFFRCNGTTNLLEENPVIFFDCLINSKNKHSLLKKFNIKKKRDTKILNIYAKGSLAILNNKINFKNIEVNDKYKASNEDLKFFKEMFENILLENGLIKIFDTKKIKKFILEVS